MILTNDCLSYLYLSYIHCIHGFSASHRNPWVTNNVIVTKIQWDLLFNIFRVMVTKKVWLLKPTNY